MSDTAITPFSSKCNVLSEIWSDYDKYEPLKEILTFGDIGFPLAYAISQSIVSPTKEAEVYINEIWDELLLKYGVEDTGKFESISDIFDLAVFDEE
jgi:hypothetical protein